MSVTSRTVRVAAIQAAPALLDLEASLDRFDQWTRKAAGQGAQLAAFGETWLTGYPAWLDESPNAALWAHAGAKAVWERLVNNAVEVGGPATKRIGALAKELGLAIVVGVQERDGRTLFNSQMPPELPPRPEKSKPDDYLVRGGSVIIGPGGKVLAGPVIDEEAVLVADCDLGEITRESLTLDVSGHYSRPDVFAFRVRPARGD